MKNLNFATRTVHGSILALTRTRPAQVRWKEKGPATNHEPTRVKSDQAYESHQSIQAGQIRSEGGRIWVDLG